MAKRQPKQTKPVEIPTEPSEPLEAVIDDEELVNLVLSAADSETFLVENPQPNEALEASATKAAFNAAPEEKANSDSTTVAPKMAPKMFTGVLREVPGGWPVPADFKLPRRAYTIGDAFTDLAKFDTQAKKVLWLRHNDKLALRYLLKLAFDVNIVWKLPPGLPPYKEHKGRPGSAPSELLRECRRIYLYLEGGNDNLPRLKREKLFQQTIEGLEKEDVKALVAIKDKTVASEYGLTRELVDQTFPGLLDTPTQVKFISTTR